MKKTIQILHEVSGATVTANLIKRGLSECVMTGVRGISEQTAKLVGPAYTLRNIPKRSDKVTGDVLSDKNYEIKLNFAGNILIKLNCELIECFLEDISDPWETKNKPKHDLIND